MKVYIHESHSVYVHTSAHSVFISLGLVFCSSVEDFAEIEDSLCIGQMVGSDERVILFLMMAKGHS